MAKIILASSSKSRQHQLKQAGVKFTSIPAEVDEGAIEAENKGKPLREVAEKLAIAKGMVVSKLHPDAVIIAGDQICALGDDILNKPTTNQNAVMQLEKLSGQTHNLYTAACLCKNGEIIWQDVITTSLHMRPLSLDEIENYVASEDVRSCCGSYRIESKGVRLFQRIDGDSMSIQGLPIVRLLSALYDNDFIGFDK